MNWASFSSLTISGISASNYASLDLTDISISTGLNDNLGMARTIVHILTTSLSKYHYFTNSGKLISGDKFRAMLRACATK